MSVQIKSYICVVNEGCSKELKILTSNQYQNLVTQVIENILENNEEEYPELRDYIVPNSIDFICDFEEEDYELLMEKMLNFLLGKESKYVTNFFQIDQVIENDNLLNVSYDMI